MSAPTITPLPVDITKRKLSVSGHLVADPARSVNQHYSGRLFYPDTFEITVDLATSRIERVFVSGPGRIGGGARFQRTYRAGDQIPSWLLQGVVRPVVSGELA